MTSTAAAKGRFKPLARACGCRSTYLAAASALLALALAAAGAHAAFRDDPLGELEARIAEARAALDNEPSDSALQIRLAELLLSAGWFEEAADRFALALSADPDNPEARAGAVELLIRQARFGEALDLLDAAPHVAPPLPALRAEISLQRSDFAEAERIFNEILEREPRSYAALVGRARCLRAGGRSEEALELLNAGRELEPRRAEAYYEAAYIAAEGRRDELLIRFAGEAVAADPLDAEARFVLGYAFYRTGEFEASVEQLRLAVRLDPFHVRARLYLGQGHSVDGYPEVDRTEDSREALARAEVLLDSGDPAGAESELRRLLEGEPADPEALTMLGAALLRRGDDEAAIRAYMRALEINPGWGLAHHGIAEALRLRLSRQDVVSPLLLARLRRRPLEEPPFLRDVFINYDSLSADRQRAILRGIEPLQRFLPELASRGATHYILPMHRRLWEGPGLEEMRGQRTFDGRLWDDVKGIGGLQGVSGIHTLDEAARGGFNMVAHEFAHQVHIYALPAELQERIAELYDRAVAAGSMLDYYAAADALEYFAQGVEAYASDVKRPGLPETARHTAQELLERDPDLFRLIAEIESGAAADPESEAVGAGQSRN